MVITYHGMEFFKVQFGEMIIALNPISKDSKIKSSRFGADIALVSMPHPDLSGVESVSFGERKPFVITGPGEYEVQGVFIKGFPSRTSFGGRERITTLYSIALEGMNMCFLGSLGVATIEAATREAIGEVDILFIPIGGDGVLNSHEAAKLAVAFGPKIIIPMHYEETGEKNALTTFLKETGATPKAVDRLTLKKKDLAEKEGEVMVLTSTT